MSNKKPSDNPKQKQSPNNNNIPPNTEAFSFLELDNFLSQEITKKDINKKNPKKKPSLEKRDNSDKKQKLRIKPNKSHAREQTKDDMMYVEDDDNQEKKQDSTKLKEKEEIKDNNINTTKNIQKKPEIKNEKFDKRLVKINLEKEKSEIQPKNKKEEEDSKNEIKDKEESKNKKNGIYDIESIINDIKEKDPKAYVPIILPFEKEESKKTLKEELNKENGLFIFQFPRQIPIKDLSIQTKTKEEENVNEEPNYDENGFLISQEFKNSFQEIKDNTKIGKLVIMKSGKVKIKMGDIYFDINEGSLAKFAQYSAIVTGNDDNQAFLLGQPFNKKLIVTPEFD
jgi:hypothetical protein